MTKTKILFFCIFLAVLFSITVQAVSCGKDFIGKKQGFGAQTCKDCSKSPFFYDEISRSFYRCMPQNGKCNIAPCECEVDSDSDSICDQADNCINTPNFEQTDLDYNGVGDVCETSTTNIDKATNQKNQPSCIPDWKCTEWSRCKDGEKTRTCSDQNNCGLISDSTEKLKCDSETAVAPKAADSRIKKPNLWIGIITVSVIVIVGLIIFLIVKKLIIGKQKTI